MGIEYYNSLSEVENAFDVEYINNPYDFYRLIGQIQKDGISLYRGVSSPTFKMYSSAQRFYLDNRERLPDGMSYPDFLKKLYEVSKKIDNKYLWNSYEKLHHDNYIQLVNTDKNWKSTKVYLDYNPIWAFHTLQHLTECSPFLDFSTNFSIALYFASQKLLPKSSCSTKSQINNYIEIVSFEESQDLITKKSNLEEYKLYGSLTEEVFSGDRIDETVCMSHITKYDEKAIKYICYGGRSNTIGKDIDYHFSFVNENCVAQSGRLLLTSNDENKTFETMWNKTFNASSKLKAYLIHKSLITEIFQYLTIQLLGKVIVPVQKDYEEEIIKLIKESELSGMGLRVS